MIVPCFQASLLPRAGCRLHTPRPQPQPPRPQGRARPSQPRLEHSRKIGRENQKIRKSSSWCPHLYLLLIVDLSLKSEINAQRLSINNLHI